MSIGLIVKKRRKILKLSQVELADKAGVTQAKISQIECGTNDNVTIENLRCLAKALDCSVIDLLPELDKNKFKK